MKDVFLVFLVWSLTYCILGFKSQDISVSIFHDQCSDSWLLTALIRTETSIYNIKLVHGLPCKVLQPFMVPS